MRCRKDPSIWSADAIAPTADDLILSADIGDDPNAPQQGWPCFGLGTTPPSVADRQADPTADDILPQIAGVLTPRGPAWGTDEAGDGNGASPMQRLVWKALAAWVADLNRRDFELATQTFPSAITFSLPDWERELGLPDTCFKGGGGPDARIAAVRARFGAVGGQSPAYFVCLARSIGYEITIEEPTQFMIDESEVGPDGESDDLAVLDEVSNESVWKYWVVHVGAFGETWFHVDEGEIDHTPLEGFYTAEDLECVLRRYSPQHTRLVFAYDA